MSLFKGSTVMMPLFSLLGLCLHHGVDKVLIWRDVDYWHFFISHLSHSLYGRGFGMDEETHLFI